MRSSRHVRPPPSSRPSPELIERTLDAPSAAVEHVRVSHRGADVAVPDQFLDHAEWRSECGVAGRGVPAARAASLKNAVAVVGGVCRSGRCGERSSGTPFRACLDAGDGLKAVPYERRVAHTPAAPSGSCTAPGLTTGGAAGLAAAAATAGRAGASAGLCDTGRGSRSRNS